MYVDIVISNIFYLNKHFFFSVSEPSIGTSSRNLVLEPSLGTSSRNLVSKPRLRTLSLNIDSEPRLRISSRNINSEPRLWTSSLNLIIKPRLWTSSRNIVADSSSRNLFCKHRRGILISEPLQTSSRNPHLGNSSPNIVAESSSRKLLSKHCRGIFISEIPLQTSARNPQFSWLIISNWSTTGRKTRVMITFTHEYTSTFSIKKFHAKWRHATLNIEFGFENNIGRPCLANALNSGTTIFIYKHNVHEFVHK